MAYGGRTMQLSKLQGLGAKQLFHETQVEAIAITGKAQIIFGAAGASREVH